MNGRAQLWLPALTLLLNQFANHVGGVDNIEAFALNHLQGDGIFGIKTRSSGTVFKRETDVREIPERDHAVAVGFDGQAVNVLGFIKRGGDFNAD